MPVSRPFARHVVDANVTAHNRKRELEFSTKGMSRHELGMRMAELRRTIPDVIDHLSSEQIEIEYPEVVLEIATSTRQLLIHLYGHLNWHLGQIAYLRRVLIGDGAIKQAGL
jgi:hypothetical protein